MPKCKRIRTQYPGVYYIECAGSSCARAMGRTERTYYIQYRRNGQQIEEKVGRQFENDMTASRAARIRVDKIRGKRPTRREARLAAKHGKQSPGSTVPQIDRAIELKIINEFIAKTFQHDPDSPKIPKPLRLAILNRDKSTCQCCKRIDVPLDVDHIKPFTLGGKTTPANLQTLCATCNRAKSNRYGLHVNGPSPRLEEGGGRS
jgi:5-methylcytosine-specific restriction endonuclease McrA